MAYDLQSRSPAAQHAKNLDHQRRKAGIVVCGLAIRDELSDEELTELLLMLGIKEKG